MGYKYFVGDPTYLTHFPMMPQMLAHYMWKKFSDVLLGHQFVLQDFEETVNSDRDIQQQQQSSPNQIEVS
jgi:hypothetical protein